MKKYLIILIALISFSCKAQQTYSLSDQGTTDIYKDNNHIKDFDGILDKFVGTWKWTNPSNSNTYLIVQFFKILDWNPNNSRNYYEDKILGNYKYVENGVVITNTLNYNSNDLYSNNHPVIMSNMVGPLFKDLNINMRDVGKNKTCKADFKIIDLNATTLSANWKMILNEGIRIGSGLTPIQSGFSIPSGVILTKQ